MKRKIWILAEEFFNILFIPCYDQIRWESEQKVVIHSFDFSREETVVFELVILQILIAFSNHADIEQLQFVCKLQCAFQVTVFDILPFL